jgi:hypothetical protein
VVHFLSDEDGPERIIATLVDALPSGSYVVATHGTPEYAAEEAVDGLSRAYQQGGVETHLRDTGEFGRLVFRGLELVPPGVIVTSQWRPDGDMQPRSLPSEVGTNAGIGRKP